MMFQEFEIEIANQECNYAQFCVENQKSEKKIILSCSGPIDKKNYMPHQIPTLQGDWASNIEQILLSPLNGNQLHQR